MAWASFSEKVFPVFPSGPVCIYYSSCGFLLVYGRSTGLGVWESLVCQALEILISIIMSVASWEMSVLKEKRPLLVKALLRAPALRDLVDPKPRHHLLFPSLLPLPTYPWALGKRPLSIHLKCCLLTGSLKTCKSKVQKDIEDEVSPTQPLSP